MNAQGAYNIRLLGFPGLGKDASKVALQQAFPVDDRQAEQVVQRIPTRVKSSLARPDALRFAKVLLKLGADIEIDKEGRAGARTFRACDFSRGGAGFVNAEEDLGDILGLDANDMPLRMPTSGEWPAVANFGFGDGGATYARAEKSYDDEEDDDAFFSGYGDGDSGPSLAALLGNNAYPEEDSDPDLDEAEEEGYLGAYADDGSYTADGDDEPDPFGIDSAVLPEPAESAKAKNPFQAPSITVARLAAAKRSGLFSVEEIGGDDSSNVVGVTQTGTELRFANLFPDMAPPSSEPDDAAASSAVSLPPEDDSYADRIAEQTGHSFRGPTPGPIAAVSPDGLHGLSPSAVAQPGGELGFSRAAQGPPADEAFGADSETSASHRYGGGAPLLGESAVGSRSPSLEVAIVPSGGLAGPAIIDPTPRYRPSRQGAALRTGEVEPSEASGHAKSRRRAPAPRVLALAAAVVVVLVGVGAFVLSGGSSEALLQGRRVVDPVGDGRIAATFPAAGGPIVPMQGLELRDQSLRFVQGFTVEGQGENGVSAWYFTVEVPDSVRGAVASEGGSALTSILETSAAPFGLRVGQAFPTRISNLPTLEAQMRRHRRDVGRFRITALGDEVVVTGYVLESEGGDEQVGLAFLDSLSYAGPPPEFD